MQETLDLLVNYAREFKRRQWFILMLSGALCLLGWYGVSHVPDKFEANAKVYIDTQSILRPLLSGLTVQANTKQQVTLLVKTLLSKPNVERLLKMADLDAGTKTELQYKDLVRSLQKEITLTKERRDNIFSIRYMSSDKQVAKRVVDSVLTLFMESSVGENREDTINAKRFIDQQLVEYENRLKSSEVELMNFKKKHLGMMPSDGVDYYQRLQAASRKLEEARLLLQELESERESVEDQLAGMQEGTSMRVTPSTYVSPSISTRYDVRVAKLESQLDELLLKYTKNHPDVRNMEEQLAVLVTAQEKERKAAMRHQPKVVQGGAAGVIGGVDLHNHLKLALSDLNTKIASMAIRLTAYEKEEQELKVLVDTIPDIEVQLGELNRDYGITKKRYNELLARRESVEISRKASQDTDDLQFKVIEPPAVSDKPSWPNRTMLFSFVLPASIGVTSSLALLLIIINPRVMSAKYGAEISGYPVIGSVSMVRSADDIRKGRFFQALFFLLFAALVLANVIVAINQ
ncbi:XrtA system polysaccharide chain length determinant [Aestuariirhabdus sp. LZHN29]|uniref:XrtA system polysaccharide chain length determinant n=1 Tax=Aestuariirhabdus sp. LZHN29 TaxID=3417462 RepID=UPI003CFB4493